jgi:hypothetical protein
LKKSRRRDRKKEINKKEMKYQEIKIKREDRRKNNENINIKGRKWQRSDKKSCINNYIKFFKPPLFLILSLQFAST